MPRLAERAYRKWRSVEAMFSGCTPEPNSGCWLWVGSLFRSNGYPSVGNNVAGHQLVWEMVNGPIPPGMFVTHTCDIPSCVNPAHLRLGTHTENMQQKKERGRAYRGGPPRKLPLEAHDAIRADPRKSEDVARDYGIHPSRVRQIRRS